jgi:zinc D-Ala-D-Ala carboxypeptidase
MNTDWTNIVHFGRDEFACPCCGACDMDEDFLLRLDAAREIAGVPFTINSGFRCEAHNRAVGGTPGSLHTAGRAADIAATTREERGAVLRGLYGAGITSVAIASSFIHADSYPADWCGLY